ncbi:MAG: hypothetical protein B6U88_01690 [Candidatus Aenigmarchaeota archaeon ex4484_56]|nr:MAG: hypothetical protein B6U88_01690 [Candidatus Aenigmarchaeota archaeon ex4484_56]
MNAIVKLFVGLLLVVAGIAWYVYGSFVGVGSFWLAFQIVFFGVVGVAFLVIGLLIVWVELEEISDTIKMKKGKKKK